MGVHTGRIGRGWSSRKSRCKGQGGGPGVRVWVGVALKVGVRVAKGVKRAVPVADWVGLGDVDIPAKRWLGRPTSANRING